MKNLLELIKQSLLEVVIIVVAIIIAVGGYSYFNRVQPQAIGGGGIIAPTNAMTPIGGATISLFKRLPNQYVFADATTTDGALESGGTTIQQKYSIDTADRIEYFINARGYNATSTMYIMPMVSLDGTNYYPITVNSTSTDFTGTTTPVLTNTVIAFTPGVATTTKTFNIDLPVLAKYIRLVTYGTDKSDDPSDGVIGFFQVGVTQNY